MEGRPASWPSTTTLDLEDLLEELRSRALEARASQDRLSALLDAVVAVSADLELSEVLGRIVEAACALVGARYGALGVLSPRGDELAAFITRGLSEDERRAIGHLPEGRGVLGLLIREPQAQRLRDVAAHPDSVGFPPHHPPMKSFLGVPIRIKDRVFGNLYLTDKHEAEEFSSEDESMIAALAAAAGVAIENAQLYERADQQRQWSEAISELTRILLENEEEGQALQPLVQHAARTASASFVAIALVDDAGELVVCAAHADREGKGPDVGTVSTGDVLTGSMWHALRGARRPLLILSGRDEGHTDDQQGPQLLKKLNADGPVAVLPLSVGSDDLGLLLLTWEETVPGAPDETLSALAEFAQQTGLALVAARSQRDRSLMALLGDRDRIARDMHDHVIQRLFATGLSLQSAAPLAQHPLVRARVDSAVEDLDEAIRHIRHTIFELHRPIPSGGLREQLHMLVDGTVSSLGFDPTVTIEGSLRGLSASLEADILAVVREALANVARHAHAGCTNLEIVAGDRVRIVVTDDGLGTDPGTAHSGLVNLGSRATARSGTFEVRPGDPRGTILCWEVPREERPERDGSLEYANRT